jgi:hypothetical protein
MNGWPMFAMTQHHYQMRKPHCAIAEAVAMAEFVVTVPDQRKSGSNLAPQPLNH